VTEENLCLLESDQSRDVCSRTWTGLESGELSLETFFGMGPNLCVDLWCSEDTPAQDCNRELLYVGSQDLLSMLDANTVLLNLKFV